MGTTESCTLCFFKKGAVPALESDKLMSYAPTQMPLPKSLSEAPVPSSPERNIFLTAVASATDRFLRLVNDPLESDFDLATEKDGVRVHTKDSLGGYIIRAEWRAAFSPKIYMEFLTDAGTRTMWDGNVQELKVMETLEADVQVFYQAYKKVFALSSRDLVVVAKKFECKGAYVDAFCSVESSACPPRPGYVRAHIVTGGYYMEDLSQGSNIPLTRVISYTEGTCGGSVPKSLVKRVSAANLPIFVKQLNEAFKQHVEKNSLS